MVAKSGAEQHGSQSRTRLRFTQWDSSAPVFSLCRSQVTQAKSKSSGLIQRPPLTVSQLNDGSTLSRADDAAKHHQLVLTYALSLCQGRLLICCNVDATVQYLFRQKLRKALRFSPTPTNLLSLLISSRVRGHVFRSTAELSFIDALRNTATAAHVKKSFVALHAKPGQRCQSETFQAPPPPPSPGLQRARLGISEGCSCRGHSLYTDLFAETDVKYSSHFSCERCRVLSRLGVLRLSEEKVGLDTIGPGRPHFTSRTRPGRNAGVA